MADLGEAEQEAPRPGALACCTRCHSAASPGGPARPRGTQGGLSTGPEVGLQRVSSHLTSGWLGHSRLRSCIRQKWHKRAAFVFPFCGGDAMVAQLTCVLFQATAPKARGGLSQETRTGLPDRTAQTEAPRRDPAVILQPGAAVSVRTGREREGPGAEAPEVCGREPEGSDLASSPQRPLVQSSRPPLNVCRFPH